ncbi:MAG TPA: STAS domain-containing protein [Gammaproteobacteria bacterium]|nr:STAS domain-containing protein [Gammaproteobacteria bacterium]
MKNDTSKQVTIIFKQNKFLLSGELDFFNITFIYEKSLSELKQSFPLVVFDFSGVHANNSAGLALMVEWLKYAKKHKKNISFVNLPENLLTIAKASRISQIFNQAIS